MRQVLIEGGPVPAEGQEFCPICAGFAKAEIEKFYVDLVGEQLRRQPDGPPLILPWPEPDELEIPPIHLATVYGITVAQQFGMMKACWGHINGLQVNRLMPGQAGDLAGMPQVPLMRG